MAGRPVALLASSAAANAASGGTSMSTIYWSTAVQSGSVMEDPQASRQRWSSERACGDVLDIGRESSRAGDVAQRRLGEGSPFGFHRPPALEGRKKARRDLRVFGIEVEDNFRDELIAAAVFRVELGWIHGGERSDERAHPIRVVKRESLVFHEGFHLVERASFGDRRLQGKPFVDDERFACMGAVEGIERVFMFARRDMREHGERGDLVRHGGGDFELTCGEKRAFDLITGGEKIERGIAQSPPPRGKGVR